MSTSTADAGIPVLTEIIPSTAPASPAVPAAQPAAPVAAQPALQTAMAGHEDVVTLQKRAVDEWDEENWDRLEREIRERILHQVLERIDQVLEQRVRDSLADVLQLAVENLAADIRGGLHNTMSDVITRAVAQEISRLQATKK